MSILDQPLTIHEANRIAGGSPKGGKMAGKGHYNTALTATSKMPCASYNLPAEACITGSRLRGKEGTACSECYAKKGSYIWPDTLAAMDRHLAAIEHPRWPDAMVVLIEHDGRPYFRWHDSGDLQSVEHLAAICEVAARTPQVQHWMPSRERRILRDYLAAGGEVPPNLVIRLSMPLHGQMPPAAGIADGRVYSTTHASTAPDGAVSCPAAERSAAKAGGSVCGDCRVCWDPAVPVVSYHLH